MRRELKFLEADNYSLSFRPSRGHDAELDLTEDEIQNVSTHPGVYIIVSADKTKFVYPQGTSPVIYIGKADNLRRRLREHLNNLNYVIEHEEEDLMNQLQHCPRYNYMRAFGAHVYLFHCLKKTQDAKKLESIVIAKFYQKYRSIPVGNGARSFTPVK